MALYIGGQKVTPIITKAEGATLVTVTVTPTVSAQTITPSGTVDGFSEIDVTPVTASIDPNIIAGNIKKDVEILGVTGSYEGTSGIVESLIERVLAGDNPVTTSDLAEAEASIASIITNS